MMLETKRLRLRPFRKSDWKDLVEGLNDLRVSKTLGLVGYPYRKKDAVEWIKHTNKEWKKKEITNYYFAMELKSEGRIIGASDLFLVNRFAKTAKTGSWLAHDYHRKGLMTEAKIAIFDFAFNKLKLERLGTEAFEVNAASNGMMKSLGYHYEGTLRRAIRAKSTGKYHDEHLYALFRKDWKKARPRIVKKIKERIKKE